MTLLSRRMTPHRVDSSPSVTRWSRTPGKRLWAPCAMARAPTPISSTQPAQLLAHPTRGTTSNGSQQPTSRDRHDERP